MRRNVDQLRNDIDSGRTGDKVACSDPAAAPLGTDDEAAGTPPCTQRIESATAMERRAEADDPKREPYPKAWLLIPLAAIVTAGAALFGALHNF